jgi:hypothetical protein
MEAAAAGVRDDRDVVAVRQKLRVRKGGVWRTIPPHGHGRCRSDHAHLIQRSRLNRRRAAWHALL